MVNYEKVTDSAHLISVDDGSHSTHMELTFSAGGAYFDSPGKEGESHLLEHCIVTRSTNKTTRQLNNYFDARGIYRNARTGPVTMAVEFSGHRDFNQLMAETLFQMAFNPAFNHKTFNQEHGIVLREVSDEYDSPGYRASRAVLNSIYIPGSIALCENAGSPCTVSALNLEDIQLRHRKTLSDSHIILRAIGGDIDEGYLRDRLLQAREDANQSILPVNVNLRNHYTNGQIMSIVNPLARDGCQLVMDLPLKVTRDNRVERWALEDILFGRINHRLRNELRLIYGASGDTEIGDQSYTLSMACGVENVERIVSELFQIIYTSQSKITSRNVTRLKQKYIRQQEINSDSWSNTSKTMETNLLDYGVPDSFEDYLDQLQNLNADSVMALYNEVISSLSNAKIIGVSNNPQLDIVMQRLESSVA
jgi:predicted Zn-dependent peptidase